MATLSNNQARGFGHDTQQLWLFWLAPIVGAALGGLLYPWLSRTEPAQHGRSTRERVAPSVAE